MKKWLQNKGFSLVELIITIAILSVVGGSVTAFVLVAQRNYERGTTETELQYEAQVVVNHLNDIVMDCGKGITLEAESLFVYDTDIIYEISWEKEEEKLYMSTYDINEVLIEEDVLLADYVTDFDVDLSEMVDNRTVSFSLELSKGKGMRRVQTEHRIKLRNDVLVNAQTTEVYEEEVLPVDPTNITLSPERVYVWPKEARMPGEEANVSAHVYNVLGGDVSQYVSWHFEGLDLIEGSSEHKSDMETIAAGIGQIQLDMREAKQDADKTFNIRARKVLSDGSVLESDNYTRAFIRTISSISVTDDVSGGTLKPGDTVNLQAKLNGFNLTHANGTPLTMEELGGVNIEVKVRNENNEIVDYNKYLTVNSMDENTGRLSIRVKNPIQDQNLMVYFTFSPKRSGYTDMSTTIGMGLNTTFIIEGLSEEGWMRESTVVFKLDQMPNTSGGYYDSQGRYVLPVRFIFRSYDSIREYNNLLSEEYHANNSGPTGDHGNVYIVQDYLHQLDRILVYLRHKDDLALAFPYYCLEEYMYTYKSGSADKMEIHVINDAGGAEYVRTVDIAPVSLGYSQFKQEMVDESGSTYKGDWYYPDECHIYLTTDKKEVSFYYAAKSGWSTSEKNFSTKIRHFFGYVGDYEDENRFDSDASRTLTFNRAQNQVIDLGHNYESKVTCEEEGVYNVRFVFAREENPKAGDVVTIRYEMNPCFGCGGNPIGYEALFDSIKGAPGSVVLHFVDKNLQINNGGLRRPGMEYCPTPAELENMGKSLGDSYYIAENERFYISATGGENKVIYQVYENGKWTNPWSNVLLRWNGSKWVTAIQ